MLGAQSFRDLATEAGYELVDSADDEPAAVFQGHNPDTNWAMLSEAALAIARGATYLASNLDTTLPTERGLLVGNGSMVAAIVSATGVEPRSAGKPLPPMFHRGAARLGSERPIVIGDRLNTDIAGGNAAGYDTLMTVTGISGHHETLSAIPEERPTLIGADMSALVSPAADAEPRPQAGFTAERDAEDPGVIVIGGGDASDARLSDPARAAVARCSPPPGRMVRRRGARPPRRSPACDPDAVPRPSPGDLGHGSSGESPKPGPPRAVPPPRPGPRSHAERRGRGLAGGAVDPDRLRRQVTDPRGARRPRPTGRSRWSAHACCRTLWKGRRVVSDRRRSGG